MAGGRGRGRRETAVTAGAGKGLYALALAGSGSRNRILVAVHVKLFKAYGSTENKSGVGSINVSVKIYVCKRNLLSLELIKVLLNESLRRTRSDSWRLICGTKGGVSHSVFHIFVHFTKLKYLNFNKQI